MNKQVSPAAFAAVLAVVIVIAAIVGWKMLGKHQAADTMTDAQKKAYLSSSAQNGSGGPSAGHIGGGPQGGGQ